MSTTNATDRGQFMGLNSLSFLFCSWCRLVPHRWKDPVCMLSLTHPGIWLLRLKFSAKCLDEFVMRWCVFSKTAPPPFDHCTLQFRSFLFLFPFAADTKLFYSQAIQPCRATAVTATRWIIGEQNLALSISLLPSANINTTLHYPPRCIGHFWCVLFLSERLGERW